MKSILKFAVILLLLLTLVGTASAAVSNVQATVTENSSGNYDVSVTWDGTLIDSTIGAFSIAIDGTSFSKTSTANAESFLDIVLTPSTSYTVTITDDDAGPNSDTGSFSTPAPASIPAPVFAAFASATEKGSSNYNLTWTWSLAGNADSLALEYDSGGGSWTDVSSKGGSGDPLTVTGTSTFIFRVNNTSSSGASSPSTTISFNSIDFTSTPAANTIKWDLVTSDWDSFEYEVMKSGTTGVIASGTPSSTNIPLVSSLDASTSYDISVRGVNSTYGYGLWTTNSVTTLAAVADFISDIDSNSDAYKNNVITDFSTEKGVTLRLNVTANEDVDFVWKLEFNNSTGVWVTIPQSGNYTVDNSSDKRYSNFSWNPSDEGEYRLNLSMTNVTSIAQDVTWNITVTPKTSGDRIWSADEKLLGSTYEWNSRSFSGFYYDLDTGNGDEWMKIANIGRSIERGDITYQTTSSSTDYQYSGWGSYEIIGFMGDKYYAGTGSDGLASNGNLSKVLIDENERIQLRTGQSLALEEGYSIRIDQINTQGSSALIVLEKDGKVIDQGIVTSPNTYTYKKTIGNAKNIEFVKIHVASVFQGTESSIVEIDAIFQISDKLTKLDRDSKIDKMKITSVSNSGGKVVIEMENDDRISLSQDSNVTLMGKVVLQVADSSTLRFAPIMVYTDPGIYEIRGTVSDFGDSDYIVDKWTPMNFEGFYYNINDNIGNSESIKIDQALDNNSRRIDKGNLTYSANTTTVDYEYSSWGQYSVIGFMGEKYYAGLGGSLLSGGNLSKVLIDTDESRRMNVGQSLVLEEGYSLRVDQINVNGNSAYFILEKDGKRVSGGEGIVQSGNDFTYNKSVGNNNVTFVKVHVDSVFMGTESSLVSISGLFQVSDNLTKVGNDAKYGKMKVDGSPTASGIVLSNDEAISLSNGNDVEFMKVGNQTMYFKVGDSNDNTLRFAPVVEQEIGSTDPLDVKLSPSTATEGDTVTITVEDRGTTIEGVAVSVNGSSVGTTGSDGTVRYNANTVGSFRVLAERSGYVNGTATLTVIEKLGNMTVRISPNVLHYGETGTISVTDSMNGSAISGATITVGSSTVGTTDSNGQLNYTFNDTGTITVMASKDKYNNASDSTNIAQRVAFVYSNFELKPVEPSAKGNTKVSFDVTNNGIESGSHTVSLIVTDGNGNIVSEDSKSVSVDVGKTKSVTLSFKAPAEGNYRVTLKETDSNRVIDLPSNIATVNVGPAKMIGSTIIYVVLAILAIIAIAVIGFVAYLFGVKGATMSNYKEVAGEIGSDLKSKFKK